MGFVLVALIAGLIGYEGITSLKNANESDTILYETNAVPLSAMIDLTSAFQRMRANGLELLIAKTPQEHNQAIKLINDRRIDIDTNKAIIERTVNVAVNQKLDQFRKADDNFYALFTKYINLCMAEKDTDAETFWKTDMETARVAEQNALLDLDNTLTERAKTRSDNNTIAADAASRNMLIFVIVGIIAAISLGLYISKNIGNPINKAVAMISEMGKGHLSGRMNLDTKDEIGMMAKTLDQFFEDLQKIVVGTLIKISEGDATIEVNEMDDKDEIAPALKKLVQTMRDLISEVNMLSKAAVEGKLSTRGNADKFLGGYKEIVAGVNATIDAVVQPINESAKVLEKLAQGDLTVKMNGEYQGDYAKIKDSINGMSASFSNALSDVANAVQATASASTQISSSSEEMAAGAQEQSSQTAEVAAAVEQMTKTILESTKNAGVAAENAKRAGEIALEGGKTVQDTILGMNNISNVVLKSAATVQELGKGSEQIGEIAQVIDDIADQTNLLALNAAIEAARAGEQGRGFAVVADEVRKLAERTTKATKEIAAMIRKIQNDTKEAVSSMNEGTKEVEEGKSLAEKAGASLQQIIDSSQKNLDVVTQVAAASEEQSSAAEQISRNIEGISSVTQQSAAGTQQIARAAEDLNRLTDNLQNLISKFKIDGSNETIVNNYNPQKIKRRIA